MKTNINGGGTIKKLEEETYFADEVGTQTLPDTVQSAVTGGEGEERYSCRWRLVPRLDVGQERMLDTILRRGSLVRVKGQHRDEPVGEGLGHLLLPLVLVCQHLEQGPRLQLGDISQLAVFPCRKKYCEKDEQMLAILQV